MPKKQRSELKAGIFVIAALAILLGVVFWLGSSNIFSNVTSKAVFYANNSGGPLGLSVDYAVQINDVKVGRIISVTVDTEKKRTLYVVGIEKKNLTIYSDGKAKVSANLMGTGSLVITSLGTKDKPIADEKHPILIVGGISEAIDNITTISNTLKKELDEKVKDSLLSKIKKIASNLLTTSKDIKKMAGNITPETDANKPGTILANIKTTSKNLASATTTIDGYVQKDLGQLLAKIREISTSVLKTANNLSTTSEKLKQFVVGNSDNLDEMIDNMVAVSANLEAASKEIRRNPWRLFYKPDEKKMHSVNIYDAARAFDEGATQLNIVVTKLKALRLLDAKDPAAEKEIREVREQLLKTFKSFKRVEDALWKEASK